MLCVLVTLQSHSGFPAMIFPSKSHIPFIFWNIEEINIYYAITYWGSSVASDSHRSPESFVLPKEMYGKFGIASTICSLIETGYPGVLQIRKNCLA